MIKKGIVLSKEQRLFLEIMLYGMSERRYVRAMNILNSGVALNETQRSYIEGGKSAWEQIKNLKQIFLKSEDFEYIGAGLFMSDNGHIIEEEEYDKLKK